MKSHSLFSDLAKVSGLCLAIILVSSSCSHNKTKSEEEDKPAAGFQTQDTQLGSSDTGNSFGLKTIHFDFDSSDLSSENKALVKEDAQILKNNPTLKIQVEGHCDARGGVQYNIALGEKRAQSVQHLMMDYGVAEDRVTVLSYGKERPLDTADSEEAYAKNRRGNLVVTSK